MGSALLRKGLWVLISCILNAELNTSRECQNYITLTSTNRSATFNEPLGLCDDKLQPGWYKFSGRAGDRMPTSCVPVRHCGTHAPGWLNGPHPAVHEGAVSRDVCFHWRSCCSWRNSVLVRNCGAFYVYFLSPTMTCNLGYCGNGKVPEPTTPPKVTTVTTTEPETTTSAPTTKPTTGLKETATFAPTTITTTGPKETTTFASTTKTTTGQKETTTQLSTTEVSTTSAPTTGTTLMTSSGPTFPTTPSAPLDLEGIFQYYGSKKTQRLPVYSTSRCFHIQLRFSTETCKGQLVEITSEDTNRFLRIALPGIGPIRVSYSTPYGKNHSVSLKGEVCDGKRHSLWFSVDIFRVSYRVDKVPVRFYAASLRRLFLSPPNIVFGKGLKGCVSGSIFVFHFTETRGYRVGTSSGCSMNKSCSDELGMQNKRIANERITASSSKSTDNSPQFARLDGSKAWCSALYDKLPYIQIQLEEPKIITEIITQGSSYHRAWAKKYEARFLENGKWKEYNEELAGNNNFHGFWSNILDPPIRTHLIRIYPKNLTTLYCTLPKYYYLRLELYGCSVPGSSCQPPISPYGSTIVYPAQRGNHKNGSVVVFGCKQGLYLTGLPIIKCNGNTWTAVNFKCLLKCNETLDIHRHSIGSLHSTLNTLSIEIHLRKGNVITAASVHLEDIRREDQQIQIRARISNRSVQINHFKPRVGEEEEKLKLSRPVITQSLQIWLIFRKGYKFSLSRTPRVFGCKSAVFRGCIMSGSAVLFREGKSYLKGRFVSIARHSLWEVLYGDKYLYKSKDKVLLDEKPNLDEIPEGTAVVGEDPRGNLKEGKIKRVCSSIQCTIETDGEEWQSNLENVRVFRKELCENHIMT